MLWRRATRNKGPSSNYRRCGNMRKVISEALKRPFPEGTVGIIAEKVKGGRNIV